MTKFKFSAILVVVFVALASITGGATHAFLSDTENATVTIDASTDACDTPAAVDEMGDRVLQPFSGDGESYIESKWENDWKPIVQLYPDHVQCGLAYETSKPKFWGLMYWMVIYPSEKQGEDKAGLMNVQSQSPSQTQGALGGDDIEGTANAPRLSENPTGNMSEAEFEKRVVEIIGPEIIEHDSEIKTPEPKTPEEADTLEETPEGTPDDTPEETPDGTPEGTPDDTPEETPDGTPEKTPDGTPEDAPEETPEDTPEDTPEEETPDDPDDESDQDEETDEEGTEGSNDENSDEDEGTTETGTQS